MANIELLLTTLDGLDQTFNILANQLDEVMLDVKKIQGKLDNQVEAKMSIDNRFNRIQSLLKKERTYFQNVAKIGDALCAEFRQIDTQQANIFRGTEKVPTAASTVKDVITKNYVSKYGSMSGFLLAAGSALTMSDLSKWNTKMNTINKNMKATTADIKKKTQTITKETNKQNTTSITNKTPTSNKKLKQYVNNKNKQTGKDYSNYNVISSFDSKYCYKQGNYKQYVKNGSNRGCSVTAVATAVSMLTNTQIEPTELLNEDGKNVFRFPDGMNWNEVQECKISGHNPSSEQELLKALYKNVSDGKPVVLTFGKTPDGNGNHYVTVIGVNGSANKDKLTPSDILVMDPANGKVKTLQEAFGKKYDSKGNYVGPKYQLQYYSSKNKCLRYNYRVCS